MSSIYEQTLFSILAIVYTIIIVFMTKATLTAMQKWGMEKTNAVFYNRKIVHAAAGGVGALIVPHLFDSWIYPLGISLVLTLFTALPHATGKYMDFVQTTKNWNDVKFTIMWGASLTVLWILLQDPFIAIIPTLFMSFGDAITGFVRNALYEKRTKKPIGNIFMLIVCIPIGYWATSIAAHPIPLWGVLAAIVASFVEHYEFGPIDDNILITVSAMLILIIGSLVR
jgi:phytol kinase